MDVPETTLMLDLMAQARAPLEAKLAEQPNHPDLLRRVAELCRTLGDLEAAALHYAALARLLPDDPATARTARLMRGDPGSAPPPTQRPCPAPFYRQPGFLPTAERDRIMAYALAKEHDFEQMAIAENHADGSQTNVRDDALRNQRGLIRVPEVWAILEAPVRAALPRIMDALEIPRFEPTRIFCNLAVTQDGGYGKPHRDDVNIGARISFLYYFHSTPKRFTGGDLMLFDRQEDPNGYDLARATRLNHQDNLLAAFPCEAMHEITRVTCPSPDFAHGRFALAGFVIG